MKEAELPESTRIITGWPKNSLENCSVLIPECPVAAEDKQQHASSGSVVASSSSVVSATVSSEEKRA
jgi:hypothetical protein